MRGAFLYSLSFVEKLTLFSGTDVTLKFGKCSSSFIQIFRLLDYSRLGEMFQFDDVNNKIAVPRSRN